MAKKQVKPGKAKAIVLAVSIVLLIALVAMLIAIMVTGQNPSEWKHSAKNSNVAFAFDEGDAQSEDGVDAQSDDPSKVNANKPGGGITITFYGLTLKFNSMGGSSVADKKVESTVTAADLSTPTRSGYAFVGWYEDYNCTQAFVKAEPTTTGIPTSKVLYAKWRQTVAKLYFNTNGGDNIASIDVNCGSIINNLPTPTKFRYIFDGWFKDSAFTNAVGNNFSIYSDTTIYAKYHVDPQYLGSLPEQPTRPGYTFVGWYYDAEFTTPYDGEPIFNDTVLYAKMIKNKYNVSFSSEGGTDIPTQVVEYGDSAVLPSTDPEQQGYTFLGWFLPNGEQYTNQGITGDTVLTAHWQIIQFKVTFMVDGEVYEEVMVDWGAVLSDVAEEVLFTMRNVVSFAFADPSIVCEESDLDKVLVVGDMQIEAKEPTTADKIAGGLSKFGDGIKRNWVYLVSFLGAAIVVSVVIAGIAASNKKRVRR